MKKYKKKVLLLLLGLIFICGSAAQAKIELIKPQVGPLPDQTNLEEGAEIKVTVRFTNDEPTLGGQVSNIVLTGARIFIDYNQTYLDVLPANDANITDSYAGALNDKVLTFCSNAGSIQFYRLKGTGAGIPVNANASVDLFSITFHVRQDQIANLPLNASWFVKWDSSPSTNVVTVYDGGGSDNACKNPTPPFAVSIKLSARPHFGGINSVSDPKTGNQLNLAWDTSAGSSDDTNDLAQTYYAVGTPVNHALQYNVYRKGVTDHSGGLGPKLVGPLAVSSHNDNTVDDVKQRYYFVVRGLDDCRLSASGGHGPNEDQNTANQPDNDQYLISHDTTPPEFTNTKFAARSSANTQVSVSWQALAGDFDSYIILRKIFTSIPASAPVAPDLGGANPAANPQTADGEINGPDYSQRAVGDVISNGWEFRKIQTQNSLTESNLVNGTIYYYAVYGFDPVGSSPYQQGRNYSKHPVVDWAIPGEAPDDVLNIRALADPNTGDITLKWTNPILNAQGGIDSDKAKIYGGALAVYTSDFTRWNSISREAAVTDPANFKELDIPIPAFPNPTTDIETSKTISGLPTSETYYFKVFSYNIVADNDRNVRLSKAGVKVAALPLKGGVADGGGLAEVTIGPLAKQTDGHGVNTLAIPFAPAYSDGATITYVQDLINLINTKAGSKVVRTFGYWDKTQQKAFGWTFKVEDGSIDTWINLPHDAIPGNVLLVANLPYQVYVGAEVPAFVLTSYSTSPAAPAQ